jgi:hypothetical protein
MLEEARSGRLAAWGNALFAGFVSPDEAAERIVDDDHVHRVADLPGEQEGVPVGLTLALGRLRSLGVAGLRLALPVPGHPLGLSGPPEFNSRALEAGEAVLAQEAGLGLVPEVHRAGPESGAPGVSVDETQDAHVEVIWRCLPVREGPPADVPSLAEAERELSDALREAVSVLTELDIAGSGPVADAALEAYRARAEAGRELLAPGYPQRAVRVLELAQRVRALIAIAHGEGEAGAEPDGREHGGAVSASAMNARAEALRPVERTARRAQVAAYDAYAEELARRRS